MFGAKSTPSAVPADRRGPLPGPNPLLDHRFVIVAGKGGVGKTSMATALALASAQAGRRTLLYQYGAQGVGRSPLVDREIGEQLVQLRPKLFAVRPSTESGMREYALMKLQSKTAYRLVFENSLVRKLLGAIPALNELIWLGKAYFHERERDPGGRPVWDCIVLDPPATGHSLYMFQVPFVLRETVTSGPLFDDANDMATLLQDRNRTALHLVSLPEEMPVNECIQLREQIDGALHIPLGGLLVNGVFPRIFHEDGELLQRLSKHDDDPADVVARLLGAARFRAERRQMQCAHLDRLRAAVKLPCVEIPYYFDGPMDAAKLDDMALRFGRGAVGMRPGDVLPCDWIEPCGGGRRHDFARSEA